MENTLQSGFASTVLGKGIIPKIACTIVVEGWGAEGVVVRKEDYSGSPFGLEIRANALIEQMVAEGLEDVEAFWQYQAWNVY